MPPKVVLNFIAGSWSYTLDTPQTTPPDTAPADLEDPFFLDVVLPDAPNGYAIDPSSIDGNEITLALDGSTGRTIVVDRSVKPTAVTDEPNTFRFGIKGTFRTAGTPRPVGDPTGADKVVVHVNTGTWSFTKLAETLTPVNYNDLSGTNDRTYIDVVFNPVSGSTVGTIDAGPISITSPTGSTAVFSGGTGTPVQLPNGRWRYYLTGHFATGRVDVTFNDGTLHSGGYANLEQVVSFTVQGPTADLVDPSEGSAVSAGTLDNRGYIDVTLNLFGHTAAQLDEASITDEDDEFTIGGTFTGTFKLDDTQAPVRNGTSNVWRYWTTGTILTGTPTLTFLTGSWGFTDTTLAGAATPVALTGAATTAATHYLDVRLTPTAGDQIDLPITAGVVSLAALPASAGVTLLSTDPTRLPGTNIYRFYFTGAFVAGHVEINFVGGSFTSGGNANVAETESLTVLQLTADVADPTNGGSTGADVLNDRGYFDVTYTVPSYASSIDVASVTDLAPEFTVSGAAVTLDAQRAPVLVSHAGTSWVFRYFYTGAKTGSLTLTFIGGSVTFLDAANKPIPLFQQREFQTYVDPADPDPVHPTIFVIDVPFGETSTLDGTSVTDSDATSPELGIAGGFALTRQGTGPISNTTGTFRYRVTATGTTAVTAGMRVVITYNAGTWTYGGTASVLQASQTATLADHTFIDVVYKGAGEHGLDPASLTGDEITLGGAGTGTGITVLTGTPGTTNAPSILADGKTVRYYLTGHFTPGQVVVTFANESFADRDGDLGVGGTASFQVIDQLTTSDAPSPSNPSPSRVFFIEISGKMMLQAFGFTDPNDPIIEIRGKVVLEIGTVHVVDHDVARFTLDASGTVKVIKLGNIASGAAHFVLEIGGGLGDTKLYGVAAFETNLAFLHPYADLTGRIVLMINTDDIDHTETISLEGIPGDAIFALDATASSAAITALNAAAGTLYSKVALPSDWVTRFQTASTASTVTLLHEVIVDVGPFAGLSADALTNAKIEKVSAADEWRVTLADGRQFFIQKAKNSANADVLIVKGEARTYELAHQSFALAVAGRFAVDDPTQSGTDFQDPDKNWISAFGAFYVQITTEHLIVFADAEASFRLTSGVHLEGHETGLLILQYGTGSTVGVAGMFDLGISGALGGSEGLFPIPNIFSFDGRIQVMFNTTLVQQDFDVPTVFRDLLPAGSPTHYTIFKSIPDPSGHGEVDPSHAEIYIEATLSGTITLYGVLHLTGFLSVAAGAGPEAGSVVIAGAVGLTIDYIGTASGTLHLLFFTDFNGLGPGVVGRATLALQAGIPGVSFGASAQVILEINTFEGAVSVNTFKLDADGNLVFDSHGVVFEVQDIGSNNPDEDFDVRLVIKGAADISIIHLDGTFIFVLKFNGGFRIAASLDANMTFGSFGGVHVDGSFNIDADGLALRLSATLAGDFGNSLGLDFTVSGTVELNTTNRNKTMLDGHIVQPGFFISLHGDVEFMGFASARRCTSGRSTSRRPASPASTPARPRRTKASCSASQSRST